MKNIILTSCGIINDKLKSEFYSVINKDIQDIKLLYITTAADGDYDDDKSWMDEEFDYIIKLGIKEKNIVEYKIGSNNINLNDFDIIYMIGGNTFYLLDMIRKNNFDKKIIEAINNGIIYIGSSAGSEILGSSIEPALPFDENNVNMQDFTGLKIIDALIIPHANRKEKFINDLKNKTNEKIYLLYDGDGIIIK